MEWLAPKLLIAIPILLLAPRVLQLLRIGQQAAQGRGLATGPVLALMLLITLWMVSASITAVGVISFIGLIAPNLARYLGARTARDQLWFSTLLGSLLLLTADFLARALSVFTIDLIPTGTAAALCGAPVLILMALRKLKAEDRMTTRPIHHKRMMQRHWWFLFFSCGACISAALFLNQGPFGWQWQLPSEFAFHLRMPRIIAALAAGIAMAVAGTLLQRLIYNPLASPDLLGVSAGASGALVIYSLVFGEPITSASPLVALAGSGCMLILLLTLARRQQFSPAAIILLGVSLTALVEALIQFALANGKEDVYQILGWLAGSTYRIQAFEASLLVALSSVILLLALSSHRWLTLLSISHSMAQGRGLNVQKSYWYLLGLVALACSVVTALLGPIAFIGLLAPHLARLIGAQTAVTQLLVASLIGSSLLLTADWLGRNLVYPGQIAAGTLAAALGGAYFIILLIRIRR